MVCRRRKWNAWIWLGVGLAIGTVGALIVAGVWPSTPLHAMATDRSGDFAMATGPVDETTEAVYFMDFNTGELCAFVIGKNPATGATVVTGIHRINAAQAMNLKAGGNPRFMLATGVADLGKGRGVGAGGIQPGKAVVYVAEVSSGYCGAFAIPFNANLHKQGKPNPAPLVLMRAFQFRNPAAAAQGKETEEE